MISTMEFTTQSDKPRPWWKRVFFKEAQLLTISNRDQLIDEIRQAHSNDLITTDAIGMIEGVMQVDHLQARNIMLPRSQIKFIHRDSSYHQILSQVMTSGHSRYPVIDENRDDIEGIIHAKDLLQYIGKEDNFDIDNILRSPLYTSETKPLNELLTEFRKGRNHLAVIVDEYGGISGLVTIEDVLELIVGQIDDEHDIHEKTNIQKLGSTTYTVDALTTQEEFNEYFNVHEGNTQFDTIGGFVAHSMGKIPHNTEQLTTQDFKFTILTSDGRRILQMEVEHLKPVQCLGSNDKKPLNLAKR